MKKLTLLLVVMSQWCAAQQPFYDVTAGNGNGIRLWQSDNWKIHMGNTSEYLFGVVTDYSIKMNVGPESGRGWTWGQSGLTPVAALNNAGYMQVKSGFFTGPLFSTSPVIGRISISGAGAELSLVNRDVTSFVETPTNGERWVIYNQGTPEGKLRFWSNGDKVILTKQGYLGIGTDPGVKLDVVGSGSSNTDLRVNGRIQTGDANNFGGIWVSSTAPMFVGQKGATSMGLYNGDWRLIADNNGNIGIGTLNPNRKLTVNGTIYGKEVLVDLNVPGPDYVFEKDYRLPSLDEVRRYIDNNRHLPEVPSAKEMEEKGINVGEMNMILLKKVEELTLYMLEANKRIDELNTELQALKRRGAQ